jgi:hypothetical protein
LALVPVNLSAEVESGLIDLCDAEVLSSRGIPPDLTASRHRRNTQPMALQAWNSGASGLRWWSSFWGDWHTTVVFVARSGNRLGFGDPVLLEPSHPDLAQAADLLGIRISA